MAQNKTPEEQRAVVAKIAKLLRLSRSPHPAEAAALAKAMQLARRHGLDVAACEAEGGAVRGAVTEEFSPQRRWNTEARLARDLVQSYFEVTVLEQTGFGAMWVGRTEDTAIARHVFGFAQEACRRCMRAAGQNRSPQMRASFKWGFFAGLCRVIESSGLRDPGEAGLVLAGTQARDRYIGERYKVRGTIKHDPPRLLGKAAAAGFHAGLATSLRRPVAGAECTVMIGGAV